ncbi:MAG: hypothetical protein AB7K52_07120 [Phycisphaerales bacterium]
MTHTPVSISDRETWRATIASEGCYWAILDAPSLGVAHRRLLEAMVRSRSPALDAAFERWLPVPPDQVHAVYQLASDAKSEPVVIACGVDRTVLEHLGDELLMLVPDALPEVLLDRLQGPPDAAAFNLLAEEFEPTPLTQVRHRTAQLAVVIALLLIAVGAAGLFRRTSTSEQRADALQEAAGHVHARLVPNAPSPAAAASGLTAELRRLRAAKKGPSLVERSVDAAATLAELLSRWPRDASASGLHVQTQSLQVTASGITITALIPAEADAEPLVAALRDLPGWTLQQSQRSSASGSGGGGGATSENALARLTLRLVPQRQAPLVGGGS